MMTWAIIKPVGCKRWFLRSIALIMLIFFPANALALTVGEVAKDLACPCECPLILEDCNMTCGLDWKEEIGNLVKEGKTKQEIMSYFIATYGEEARLSTLQKIEGKIYQYTRGFGTTDWTILWAGIAFWAIIFVGSIYYGVRRYIA